MVMLAHKGLVFENCRQFLLNLAKNNFPLWNFKITSHTQTVRWVVVVVASVGVECGGAVLASATTASCPHMAQRVCLCVSASVLFVSLFILLFLIHISIF